MKLFKTESEIESAIAALAQEIDASYAKDAFDEPILAVCVLKGAVYFYADLTRRLKTPIELEFIQASSYGAAHETSGSVKLGHGTGATIQGRRVLLVDDIIDTGLSLDNLKRRFKALGAKEIKSAVLVNKPARRKVNVEADFYAFESDNVFLVGYGMDDGESQRELSDIWYVE